MKNTIQDGEWKLILTIGTKFKLMNTNDDSYHQTIRGDTNVIKIYIHLLL